MDFLSTVSWARIMLLDISKTLNELLMSEILYFILADSKLKTDTLTVLNKSFCSFSWTLIEFSLTQMSYMDFSFFMTEDFNERRSNSEPLTLFDDNLC